MKTSVRGAAFIMREEGCVTHPYNDAVNNATIGVGHLLHHGPVTVGDRVRWRVFDRNSALRLLRSDLKRFEDAVNRAVHVPLEQHEFDALVSFAFNVGTGAMADSHAVACLVRGGADPIAAGYLREWGHSGPTGKLLYGRRCREAKLFLTGDYGDGIVQRAKRVLRHLGRPPVTPRPLAAA